MAAVLTAALFLNATLWTAMPAAALAAPPEGDGPARVLLVPIQKSEVVRDIIHKRIQDYTKTLLSMSGRVALLGPEALQKPAEEVAAEKPASPSSRELEQADEALWKGKEHIENKRFRSAIEALKGAFALYEKNYVALVDYEKLVDSLLHLAVAYYRAGYEDTGEDTLAKVIVLRPDRALPAREFSTGVKEAADMLKARFGAARSGTVRVTSPTRGSVYLDGVLQGQTPITLKGMYPGTHYVQVRSDGYEPWGERFQAPQEGKRLKYAAALTAREGPAPTAAKAEGVRIEDLTKVVETGVYDADFKKTAKATAAQADVNFLFMGYVSKKGESFYALTPFLYDAASNELVELDELVFDSELSNLQVNLLILEDNLVAATKSFPKDRRVVALPECYKRIPKKEEPKPVVAVAPAPVPVPVPAPAPAPAPKPAPKPAAKPAPAPVLSDSVPMYDPDAPVYDPDAPVYDPAGAAVRKSGDGDDEEWYEKWWVWTIVGGVVAAGAITAGVMLGMPDEGNDKFAVQVIWQ